MHDIAVRSCVRRNRRIRRHAAGHINRKAEETANRRHGSQFAFWEQPFQFLLFQLRSSHQLFSADSFWIRDVSIRLISITPPANRS